MQGTGRRRRQVLVMAAMIAIAGMLVVVASELSRVFASVHAPGGESASVEATPAAELLHRPTRCVAERGRPGKQERRFWGCLIAAR